MAKAVTPEERWRYVLKGERDLPQEKQTVFILKALSRKGMAACRSLIESDQIIMGYQVALEQGLVGWENFRDETGALVEFKIGSDGKPDQEANLNRIDCGPAGYGDELAAAVIRRAKPTEEQAKNSASPATSSPASSPTGSADPAPAGNG